jgi:hypothetical protein
MSVKITVSYTEDEELQDVIVRLGSKIHHVDKRKNTSGIYKKADIIFKR